MLYSQIFPNQKLNNTNKLEISNSVQKDRKLQYLQNHHLNEYTQKKIQKSKKNKNTNQCYSQMVILLNQIILRFEMIDRVLNFGPVQQDSYYFQLIPISLTIVNPNCELPASGTTYRFVVNKGQQKFDQNKIPIQANFQVVNQRPVMVINTCRLNFYLANYIKGRKQEFLFKVIQRENNQDYELGEFKVAVDDLIAQFKDENKVKFQFKSNFSEDYQLEFQIYVEKNRMALQRNIRDNKAQRINKSPLRSRKEERVESPKKVFSPKQEKKESVVTPSRDFQEESAPEPTNVKTREEKTTKKVEVEEKIETPEPQVNAERPKSPPRSEKAPTSTRGKTENADNNDVQSRRTGHAVPLVTTKFKPVSRLDAPAQVNLENSVRLSESAGASQKPSEGDLKEKAFMWIFLIVSFGIMYLAMHPNRKV